MRLRVLTVVWGREFVDRFLSLTLRSLAAEGNLPDVARRHDLTYDLHSPPADIDYIRAHPVYKSLASRVSFRLHPILPGDIDFADSMSHWVVWKRALAAARADDVYVISVAADHVFADGALARWAALFEEGHLAIYCPGMQVVAETMEAELDQRFPSGAPIVLPRTQMLEAMFRHLHPVMITMLRGSPRSMAHPEFHLRGIAGHGMVQSIMTSHAVAFHPGRISITDNFCAIDRLDRVAFEPSWFLSAEPLLKYVNHILYRARMDEATLSHYGVWADGFFLEANLLECRIPHTYAIGAAVPDALRRRGELAARAFVVQMQTSRRLFRIWRALRREGLYAAARWLAAAHILARARRRLLVRGPATLFVPQDDALDMLHAGEAERLLAGRADALIQALRAHVARGRYELSVGDSLLPASASRVGTLDGGSYSLSKDGAVKITHGPVRVDDLDIYVIDRPLGGIRLRAQRTGDVVAILQRSSRRAMAIARQAAVDQLQKRTALHARARRMRADLMGRRQGLMDAVRATINMGRVRDRSPSAQPNSPERIVSDLALATYQRATAALAVSALRDLKGFYEEAVFRGSALRTAPAEWLPKSTSVDARRVASILEDVVRLAPAFTEAWLELGHARLECGDETGALAAFDRARTLPPTRPTRTAHADVRSLAALEWARLMEKRDQSSHALELIDSMPVLPPYPWKLHLWRARTLLSLGRVEDALAACERCMDWNHYEGRFQDLLPRSAADIERRLAPENGRPAGCSPTDKSSDADPPRLTLPT